MDKKKLRAEIKDLSRNMNFHADQADLHRTTAEGLLTMLKQHQDQLVDMQVAEKPKLRHWDYGVKEMLRFVVTGVDDTHATFTWRGTCDEKVWTSKWLLSELSDGFVFLGNIFDDLAAMQEDVERFKIPAAGEALAVDGRWWENEDGAVYLHVDQAKDRVSVPVSKVPSLILNLRRMYATHMRKQANG